MEILKNRGIQFCSDARYIIRRDYTGAYGVYEASNVPTMFDRIATVHSFHAAQNMVDRLSSVEVEK